MLDSPESGNLSIYKYFESAIMKKSIYILLAIFLVAPFAIAQKNKTIEKKLLRHVVLFKFRDSTDLEDEKKIEDAFRALPSKIKEVQSFEWGLNNSPEGLNQGFTHCFFVTFKSEKDRAIYLPHPAHLAFVEVLKPHLDKVLVIDYWAKK